jgi:endonuclease YncB( thermonuclease family)
MIRAFLVALLIVLGTGTVIGAEITGRVVGITDGDTLTLLTPQRVGLSQPDNVTTATTAIRIGLADIPPPR